MIKKNIKYYLSLNYPVIVVWDPDDRIYYAEFPDLPGCMAHGKTLDSAYKLANNVKKEWIETVLSSGAPVPEPKAEEDYSGRFVVRIPPSLHKRLSDQAGREGRSLNQHVAVLLSERSAALTTENAVAKIENIAKVFEAQMGKPINVTISLPGVGEEQGRAPDVLSTYLGEMFSLTGNKYKI